MNRHYKTVSEMIHDREASPDNLGGGLDSSANYSGEDHSGYVVAAVRTRDNEDHPLVASNWYSMLKRLGGERGKAVVITSVGHWGCGWIEYLLVSKKAPKRLALLREALNDLSRYPILDECDYEERNIAALREYVADVYGWMTKAERERFVDAVQLRDFHDNDGSIYIRKEDEEQALSAAGIMRSEEE